MGYNYSVYLKEATPVAHVNIDKPWSHHTGWNQLVTEEWPDSTLPRHLEYKNLQSEVGGTGEAKQKDGKFEASMDYMSPYLKSIDTMHVVHGESIS